MTSHTPQSADHRSRTWHSVFHPLFSLFSLLTWHLIFEIAENSWNNEVAGHSR